MTSNNAFKKTVREYADANGLTYTEARRRVLASMKDLVDRAAALAADEPINVTIHGLHRASESGGRLPMPWYIHRNGMVRRQDHWRGEPYRLVGFADPAGPEYEIAVDRVDWLKDPQSAVGMQAVFMDHDRAWATYNGVIDRVSEQSVTIADPGRAWVNVTARGVTHEPVPVGHLLEHLVPDELAYAEQVGWRNCDAATELLWLAFISEEAGDDHASKVSEALDDLEPDEFDCWVTGPAVGLGEDDE